MTSSTIVSWKIYTMCMDLITKKPISNIDQGVARNYMEGNLIKNILEEG